MGLLATIGNALTGGLIGQIGDVIGKTNTTDKERLQLQIELTKVVQDYELQLTEKLENAETELTDRMKLDMESDSWLSKNIRPLVLAFLTITTVLLAWLTIFVLSVDKVTLLNPWIETLTTLLLTVYSFYFGSRGIEKIGQLVTQAWSKKQ